ncbi:creatininase family protein, partial [Leucobacter soli]
MSTGTMNDDQARGGAAGDGWHRWQELARREVVDLAREGLVVVPLGATEQHGPFLPTGTDIMLSTRAVEGALDLAAPECDRPLILAQFLGIGCSAHHLPFGGTISLPPQVMIDVLVASMLSMAESGVSRIVLVNGHGGNTGVCHAAASEAASRSDLTIAALDYWEMASPPDPAAPGHAGAFETSLMLAVRPDLVAADRER